MKIRASVTSLWPAGLLSLSLLAGGGLLTAVLPTPVAAAAPSAEDGDTIDILYMEDGRELQGEILDERDDAIVFKLIHESGITTKVTYLKSEIAEIHRDVPVDGDGRDTDDKGTDVRTPVSPPASQPERTYGALRTDAANADAPSLYIVPMKGQMGTDITPSIYKDILEDARVQNPDWIVIEMECRDAEDRVVNRIEETEGGYSDIGILDDFREVAELFRTEYRDIPQVIWIHDALGSSTIMALAFDQLFMSPDARLGGIAHTRQAFAVQDDEVKAKFREAYMALLTGFSLFGGYDVDLMQAMVRPEQQLSATWKGRTVDWQLDTDGAYVLDANEKVTVTFSAKNAEDFCVSQGTAENLDDLALLMGIREYRVIGGDGEAMYENYTEDWRRSFEKCQEWLQDARQYSDWATGEDTRKYLGQSMRALERVVAQIDRYRAVELRLQRDFGVRRFDLITAIETIKEQLRAMGRAERNRDRGGRGGGTGFGGG